MDNTTLESLLPPVVAEMVELIGLDGALAVVEKLGGARFRFGGPFRDLIADTVGEANAEILIKRFGTEAVELPRCQTLLQALKMAKVAAQLQSGTSANTLALQHGVTRRSINNWKKAAQVQSLNNDLFNEG